MADDRAPMTRDAARSAAIGAINLTVFGAIWALAALGSWSRTPGWAFGSVIIIAAALIIVGIARLVSVSRWQPTPADSRAEGQAATARRWFWAVVAAQAVLIGVAVVGLIRLGRPQVIPVVVAAIVGLHFWPLARLFHLPVFWITGGVLLLIAATSLLIADEQQRWLALGLAVAVVLWGSAAFLLGSQARRQPLASRHAAIDSAGSTQADVDGDAGPS